jgi:hypothetical protein
MNKTLLLPALHSNSDLITNSSSETFVCNSDVTQVETVKEIISVLWNSFLTESEQLLPFGGRYEKEYLDKLKSKRLFGDIFEEPYFSKWSLNLFHDLLHGDFYLRYNIKRDREIHCDEFRPLQAEFDCLVDKYEDWERLHRNCEEKDSQEVRYNTFIDFFKPAIDAFTQWFYAVCLPDNGFSVNEGVEAFKLEFEFSEWRGLDISIKTESDNPKHLEFLQFASKCLDYGYEVRKGQLILNSVEDNSIPYHFFCKIEDVFGGERTHLG